MNKQYIGGNDMRRRTLLCGVILILGLLSWTTIGISEDKKPEEKEPPKVKKEYTLALKYAKGEKINVEKKTAYNVNVAGKIKYTINPSGGQEINQNINMDNSTSGTGITKYEEELLEVSEKGEIDKLKREYFKDSTKSKSQTTLIVQGETQEQPAKEETKDSPLDGKTIILERDNKEIKVKIKDSKAKLPEDIEKTLMIDDLIKVILPKEPVKIGDTWSIDPKEGWKIFELTSKEMKRLKPKDFSAECTLKEVTQKDQSEYARIVIKGKIELETTDLKSIFNVNAQSKDGEDMGNPLKGMDGSMTMTIKYNAEFLFNISQGKPVSLEINSDEIKGIIEGGGTMKQQQQGMSIDIDMEMKLKIKGDGKSETTYKYEKEK